MRQTLWLLVVGLTLVPLTAAAEVDGKNPQLFMPDGQLKSHPVRVYVTQDISANQQPRLRLLRSHAVTKKAVDEAARTEPGFVATGQEWVEQVGGVGVRRTGTLLMFDLGTLDFGYKAMMRVMPVVTWTEGGAERTVVAPGEVNLGNIVATIGWTALAVGATLLLVAFLCWRGEGFPSSTPDRRGRPSVSRSDAGGLLDRRHRQRYPRLWHGEARGPGDPHISCCPHGCLARHGRCGVFSRFEEATRGGREPRRAQACPRIGGSPSHLHPGAGARPVPRQSPDVILDAPVAGPLRSEEHPRRRHLGCAVAAGSAHGFQPSRLSGAQTGSVAACQSTKRSGSMQVPVVYHLPAASVIPCCDSSIKG